MKASFQKTILFSFLLIAMLFCAVLPASAQGYGPTDSGELEAFIDAYLAEQMDTYHIPGVAITFVKDGNIFFSKGYGYADIESQTPFDKNTLLTTASLGKAFTAVGVLQLSERGMLDLHEDVRPYFQDFQLETRFDEPLTFANLLTHTDGFEARMIGGAALTQEDLIPLRELIHAYNPTQLHPPGKYMTYSDFPANLAGYLTQEISGVSFEQYMAGNILSPLGMDSSTFDQHLSDEMIGRLATGYEYQDGLQEEVPLLYIRYGPAGGLRTTAADMNHFMLALLNGGEYNGARIMDEQTVQMMFTQQFAPDPSMAGITYGLFEHFHNGQRALLRDGDGVGTRSRMVLFPEQKMGFFISYNSGDSNLRLNLVNAIIDRYFPSENSSTPMPMNGYRERAATFSGTYRPLQADMTTFGKSMYFFSQLVEVTATDDGYLSIAATGMGGDQSSVMGGFEGTSLWVEVEPLHFERVDGDGQLSFVQDESGHVIQMTSGQGYHSTFAKVAWYEGQNFQIILIELAALLILSMLLSTFVVMPFGALIRKIRKQEYSENNPWLAVTARVWAATVAGMLALFVFRAIGVLYAIDAIAGMPNFVWGVSDEIVSALNGIYLPVLLSLPLPIFVGLAWGNRWWKVSSRVHYTLVTLAVMAVIWWANYWNLLGFRM
ncbi:MAG TPA: serine hydrolase domain-containing protein [Anaerolineales bacterium]|nr:serine hydrolase domain-containing protein [Anaerolineales bacterium]